MVIGALSTVSDLQVQTPDVATTQSYPDVAQRSLECSENPMGTGKSNCQRL